MEIAVKAVSFRLNPNMVNHRQIVDTSLPKLSCNRACFSPQSRCDTQKLLKRKSHTVAYSPPVFAVLSAVEDTRVSSSQFKDFIITTSTTNEATELKVSVEVSCAKTQAIFDDVYDKMVAAAQPIPGFRRAKGGFDESSLRAYVEKFIDKTVKQWGYLPVRGFNQRWITSNLYQLWHTSLSANANTLLHIREFSAFAGFILGFGAYFLRRLAKPARVMAVMGCVATICFLLSIPGTQFPENDMLWLTAALCSANIRLTFCIKGIGLIGHNAWIPLLIKIL